MGIGLNSTDTLVLVPHFPAYAGKAPIEAEILKSGRTGGQRACHRRDARIEREVHSAQWATTSAAAFNSRASGRPALTWTTWRSAELPQSDGLYRDRSIHRRTNRVWRRPDCLRLDSESITAGKIAGAKMLHIDGHDTVAVEKAARLARSMGIPVSVDVDTVYHGFDRVLGSIDYLVASSEFPSQWTNERDPFRALQMIQNEYQMKVAAMTLGSHGALARVDGKFVYSPAFVVNCVDTTGAGDVFHGAFCYAVLGGMSMRDTLEFANAMAALNCTQLGARGGIATVAEARVLMERGERRSHREFASTAQSA